MSIKVGLGAGLAPMSREDYWRWIAFCDEGGIDSVWHSDQLLGKLPDPLVMAAAIAARTTRLRFGMNALVVPFREPLTVAKQIASIDYLSGGRFLPTFGVGNGNDPYWQATGQPPGDRGQRSNEAITLIRALLEQEEVTFEGRHYRYHGPGVCPRPVRPIPLWIGGDSPAAIRRTAMMGDGWLGGLSDFEKTKQVVAEIKKALSASGREIDDDHYGASILFRIGEADHPAVRRMREKLALIAGAGENIPDLIATGHPEAIASHFQRYISAGVSKFVAIIVAEDSEDLLNQTVRFARDVIPAVEATAG